MTNLLILLTLPEPIRGQYRDLLAARFPDLNISLVDHHSKVGPHIASADALVTFAPMLADKVLASAPRLKWVQALGTGVDNLVDRPCLRKDVIVTNVHGIHGPPVSEAAVAAMLGLARNFPRAIRLQEKDMNIVVHPTYIRGHVLSWVCDNYLIEQNGPGERLHHFPEIITELG